MTEFYGSAFLSQYGETPNLTWVAMLRDLTPAQYQHGFEQLRNRESSFPPNPGEFRAIAEINNAWERQCHKIIETENLIEDKTAQERRCAEGLEKIRKLRAEAGL